MKNPFDFILLIIDHLLRRVETLSSITMQKDVGNYFFEPKRSHEIYQEPLQRHFSRETDL